MAQPGWNRGAPTDQPDDEPIDTEAIGRLLLERQSPEEHDQARQIFRQLRSGADPEDLRDQIDNFAHLMVRRVNQRRRQTR